jgi:hypothetical protein
MKKRRKSSEYNDMERFMRNGLSWLHKTRQANSEKSCLSCKNTNKFYSGAGSGEGSSMVDVVIPEPAMAFF